MSIRLFPVPHPMLPLPTAPSTGIAIALYASDPSYNFEIQRATSSAGAGATSIASDIPGTQQIYIDQLGLDNTPYWYRIRHMGFGDTPSGWTNWVGGTVSMVMPANVERPAPVLPTYSDAWSDNGTTGTYTLTLTDPQSRVTAVEYASQSGLAGKTGYLGMSGGPVTYTGTVTLAEKGTSAIWSRITGYDIDGVSKVLRDLPIDFRDSDKPSAPDVLPTIDDSGNVTLRLTGDEKTGAFRWAAADNSLPSDGACTGGTVVAGRDVLTGTVVTIALGHYAGIKVVACRNSDGSGTQSIIVSKQFQRQNKSTAKTILINWPWFVPQSGALYIYSDGVFTNGSGGTTFFAPIDIPPGATITSFSAELYSQGAADVSTLKLQRFNGSGAAPTQIGSTLTATGGAGYSTPSSSFSETAGTAPYHLQLFMQAITTGGAGSGLTRATVVYTSPDLTVAR